MQARAIITANGDVQGVGYRGVIERAARKMKLIGFVENIKPYDVRIVCEGEFEYFEIKRGDMAEKLGERLDIANAKMTVITQKQDIMIEKLDNNTSILIENTSILIDLKNETNDNLGRFTNIMTKHDVDAQERITNLTVEISGIKDRLARLESAIG